MTLEESLAALRAWRDEFARSHGYDLAAMGASLQKMELTAGRKVVRGEPRRPSGFAPVESSEVEPRDCENGKVA